MLWLGLASLTCMLEVTAAPEVCFLLSLLENFIVGVKLDHVLKGKMRFAYLNWSHKNKVTRTELRGFYQ